MIKKFYNNYILAYPKTVLLLLFLSMAFFTYQAQKLAIDASSETLLLENDQDLKYFREVYQRYSTQDFLFITYSPKNEDLLSENNLNQIKNLTKDLEKIDIVDSVLNLTNVPLLQSPPKPVKELLKNVPTLQSSTVDKKLARQEFLKSPIYQKLLVSSDFKTTALQVNLVDDPIYQDLLKQRNKLRKKAKNGTLTEQESLEYGKVQLDFKNHRDKIREQYHQGIQQVRAAIDKYRNHADLFLGGVSMIADDTISFLKNDLKIFGTGVLLFLIITLTLIFRQFRWLMIPILTCSFSVLAITGFLGLFGWEITVISSNFISIQIIITMAVTIHLIVRYRELITVHPEYDQHQLVLETVTSMWKPCLYAILTTVAGFCSLIFCDILPVINFGWMMSAGITVSLLLIFLIFPSILILMEKLPANISFESHFKLIQILSNLVEKHGRKIIITSFIILFVSLLGVSKLIVENSFINYFKKNTEIYQGMKVIDQELGGTTPLDIILDFNTKKDVLSQSIANSNSIEDDDFADLDDDFEANKTQAQYWFTTDKMQEIEKLHKYLDSLPETGKVLSLGTMLEVGKTLNDGKPLDNFTLALIYNELPEHFRKIILNPYVSVEDNQVRFSTRVIDSDPNLRRNEFLKQIKYDLTHKLGFAPERVHLSNLLVLYNNMLQSLFNSQILTLGATIMLLMVMFLILFRSFKIAFIAIFPNILSIGAVLGFMGWVGIPLDIMTITIASISVGIAVDDTIHYIHRFKKELAIDGDYIAAMHRCHSSIGYAMYYTSIVIIIGFSILIFSNFVPSIYFGLLTGMAMIIALLAALTLLPQLIILMKPFKYKPQGN